MKEIRLMDKVEFYEKVSTIQTELKAPKSQFNKFGNYNYRNCEDILEALKPLLCGLIVIMDDDIVQAGDRFYVKSTATITDGEHSLNSSAFARESLTRKGMDDAQLTGATSSYSRKYALNGLLLIDDTKDADSINDGDQCKQKENKSKHKSNKPDLPWYNEPDFKREKDNITRSIRGGMPPEEVVSIIQNTYKISKEMQDLIKSI